MAVGTTVALNLTFLITLGIGLLMFLGHVLVSASVLTLVGAVRFVAVTFTAFGTTFRLAEARNHPYPPRLARP